MNTQEIEPNAFADLVAGTGSKPEIRNDESGRYQAIRIGDTEFQAEVSE